VRVVAVLLLVLLSACVSRQVEDGPPAQTLSADQVEDAVVRADPILAQGNLSPYEVNGVEYHILDTHTGYREIGTASWYGTGFHGRKTSNGEIYDLYAPTAAHKTLPIPCYVEVTNLQNDRSIIVRVNDRGPFLHNRLIDLSYAAAVKLGFVEQGTAPVEVRVLDVPGVDDRRQLADGRYRYLQVGAFSSEDRAREIQRQLAGDLQVPVQVAPVQVSDRLLYRVRLGPIDSGEQLEVLRQRLLDWGYAGTQPLP